MGTEERSQVTPRTLWTIGLNVVAMAILLYLLYRIRAILVLVAVAVFLAAAINPVVQWLEGRGVRRGLGILGVFLLLFVLVGLVPLSFVPIFTEQGQGLVEAAPELVDRVRNLSVVQWADRRFNLFSQIEGDLQQYAQTFAASALGVVTGIFKGLFAFGTVLVMTVFILLFGGGIFGKGLEQLPPGERPRYLDLAAKMQKTVGGYVIGTLIVALIGGIVMTLALLIVGVPYFLPLGLAMFLLGIIPYIGPTLAAVLIVGTTFAAAGLTSGIIMTAVVILYQVLENNLLQPLVQRRTIRMNPLIIFLAFLSGATLAGVLGALLALPVAGVIQIVVQDKMNGKK